MKRIVVLSNLDEQCGNAQYGRILTEQLSKWYSVEMLSHALWSLHHKNPDVVIINWHPARVHTSVEHVRSLKAQGMKVVLLLQNSFDWDSPYGPEDLVTEVDAVVAHEHMNFVPDRTESKVNFCYIPHGILEVPGLHEWDGSIAPMIGTAGFQFDWKNTPVVVDAAKQCGVIAKIFCPPYPGFDRNRAIDRWQQQYDKVHVDRNWLSEEQVVRALAENVLNIFWFESRGTDDQFGQSGSVRLGLAARRPTIISKHRKFKTLMPYRDELYVASTVADVHDYAKRIVSNPFAALRPNRVLRDMGWSACAEKYRSLIESL